MTTTSKPFVTERAKAIELYRRDPVAALRFCKRWRDLGAYKSAIVRGAECLSFPSNYAEMGYDPNECITEAIMLLGAHLGLRSL